MKWITKNANWDKYQEAVQLPNTFENPFQACEQITLAILDAATQTIKKSTTTKLKPSAYWWNSECSRKKKEKKRALSHYKNHRGDLKSWDRFIKAKENFNEEMTKTNAGKNL